MDFLKDVESTSTLQAVDLSHISLARLKWVSLAYMVSAPVLAFSMPLTEWMGEFAAGTDKLTAHIFIVIAVVHILAMVAFVGSTIYLISRRIWWRMEIEASSLDEWDITAKMEAQNFTYKFLQATLIPVLVIGGLLELFSVLNMRLLLAFALSFVLMSFFMPVLHFAWTTKPLDMEE